MLACSGQANASSYTFTDLSALAGANSQVYAINNVGQIAGGVNGNATLWEGSTVTTLASTGGTNTYAYAINDSGQVAGQSVIPSSISIWAWHATTRNGNNMTLLGALPDTVHSWAQAINSTGVVAGLSITDRYNSHGHATVWNGSTITDLGIDTYAFGINDTGQVVGIASDSGVTRATLWNGITATTLGSLGSSGGSSAAYAINNAGVVVGYSCCIDTEYHATVWNGATITDLGAGQALAINNTGVVVGVMGAHAALWNGTSFTDLNSFLDASTVSEGWELNEATGINDNGWIVGYGFNKKIGATHGFLLTPTQPVPEPETYAMLLAGLGMLGTFVRRKKLETQT
jgi:probable HAF family extracellular repeat protein